VFGWDNHLTIVAGVLGRVLVIPERTLTPSAATNKIIGPRALPLKGVNAVRKLGPTIYASVEMLTLYHNDMSVCAAKVRTALAAKKLDWNGVHQRQKLTNNSA
jgi:hypothetical protein